MAMLAGLLLLADVALKKPRVSQVQQQLNELVASLYAQHEQIAIKAKQATSKPFTYFSSEEENPFFIFKNNTAWYWSGVNTGGIFQDDDMDELHWHQTAQGGFLALSSLINDTAGNKLHLTTLLTLEGYESGDPLNQFFHRSVAAINANPAENLEPLYYQSDEPLLYVQLSAEGNYGEDGIRIVAAWLLLFALLIVGTGLLLLFKQPSLSARNRLVVLVLFVAIRVLYIEFSLPYAVFPLSAFSPRYFASGWLNPSLADFFLNMLWYAGIWFMLARLIFTSSLLHQLQKRPLWLRWLLGGLLLVGFTLLNLILVRSLFRHVQFSLDITESIELNPPRLLAYVIFFLAAFVLYQQTLGIFRYLVRQPLPPRKHAITFFIVLVVVVFFFQLEASYGWLLLLVLGAWLFWGWQLLRPEKRKQLSHSTPIFGELLGVIILAAVSGGIVAVDQFYTNRKAAQEQLANQVLSEQDVVGEFLLSEAGAMLQRDNYIINRFLSPLFSLEGMSAKVRRKYLSRYFDKYQLDVQFFSLDGQPLRSNQGINNYNILLGEAQRLGENTEYAGLYRLTNNSASWQYHYRYFLPIAYTSNLLGYVVMDLQLQDVGGSALYPELLLSSQSSGINTRKYSFALYRGDSLQYTNGIFAYADGINAKLLAQPQLYEDGLNQLGYHHYGVKAGTRTVIVSSKGHGPLHFYANFAFLLLLLLFVVSFIFLIYLAKNRTLTPYLSLTTKVQLYLNAAILVPLLVITASTLSFLNRTYRNQTEETYFAKADRISRSVAAYVKQYKTGYINSEQLTATLEDLARFANADLNLFDTSGHLIATNQPTLFQKYLAPYANPEAMAGLVEGASRQIFTSEEINHLEYKAAYITVVDPLNGKQLGVLGLPFFDAGYRLQEQLSSIFSNFVGIFAFLFFVFLFVLHVMTRRLTFPLRYIAERLRLTSLSGRNEPLEWPAKDEIGKLVQEYNQMLRNLQISKEALSKSEKESAWREMAKQVAHEIKNPLTPMRLSLQHLNRRLDQSLESPMRDKVNQSFQSLLEQVDTLSDIATTFSAFAKMPVPVQERFNITAMVVRVVDLFKNADNCRIKMEVPETAVWVEGDEQLMQRTLNNLIINGQQAVTEGKTAKIKVSLRVEGQQVRLEVADNGEGIPEAIHNKVFVPNFSTKNSGSGLGLAIAKRGVEHAGGKIWFETATGEGTTFYIDLPIAN